jgi:fucose permease
MNLKKLFPVLLCFFAMGFVDLVGIATNYVKEDLVLSDTAANVFPSMVFFWFLIFSVPTGMLMNKIGRKKTVIISLVITIISLIVPVISVCYAAMLISFSLLGIGNTLLQVSLNPLVSNIISNDRLASTLTLGQFVKAIASFVAPLIAAWGALQFNYWQVLFPVFCVIAVLATLLLGSTSIEEEQIKDKNSTFGECIGLLANSSILLMFFGIVCHVGLDVGINVTIPKLMIERIGMALADAGYATSLYFLFRTIGSFSGSFILTKVSKKIFFAISTICLLSGMGGLFFVSSQIGIYICIAIIGFGNSNIFPIIFTQAMQYLPAKKNEVSGLMIMGLFGGTIFPLAMGLASDSIGTQAGAIAIMMIGILFLFGLTLKINK